MHHCTDAKKSRSHATQQPVPIRTFQAPDDLRSLLILNLNPQGRSYRKDMVGVYKGNKGVVY